MSYIVFRDDPTVRSAQEAERRGAPYWPLVQMGTFGAAHGCPACRSRTMGLGQAEGCAPGQTLTPSGACVAIDPGTKIRKVGWTIVVASAITVVGLFAATLTLGTKGG